MEKYVKEFQEFMKVSLKSMDNLMYYFSAQKNYKEVDSLVESIEEIMVNDTIDNRFGLMLNIYEVLSRVITESPDVYIKYKFRYFLLNWQVDKVSAMFDLKFIFKQITVYNEQTISATAFYKLVFSSKQEALEFLKNPLPCNPLFIKRISTIILEEDYYSLINRMRDLWYFPVIKKIDKCLELLQKIHNRTLRMVKLENNLENAGNNNDILNTPNVPRNIPNLFSPVAASPEIRHKTIPKLNKNPIADDSMIMIKYFKDNVAVKQRSKTKPQINDNSDISFNDSFEALSLENSISIKSPNYLTGTIKSILNNDLSKLKEKTVQAHSVNKTTLNKNSVLNQTICPSNSFRTPLKSSYRNILFAKETPVKNAINVSNYYICSPHVRNKLQNDTLHNAVDPNFDFDSSIKLDYDNESQIDTIIKLTRKTSKIVFGLYECHKLIGEGGMSKVYEAIGKHDGKTYAMKVMEFNNDWLKKDVEIEIKIMTIMSSTNYAIRLIESLIGNNGAIIVMEKAKYDMKIFFNNSRPNVTSDFILKYWLAMLRCVKALHDKRISHLDLKLQNFVMTENDRVKLIDFGISRQLSLDSSIIYDGESSGTVIYMSPELLLGVKEFEPKKCDVWAMGIVLYTLIYTVQPQFVFENEVIAATSSLNYADLVTNINYKFYMPQSRKLTPLLKKLMEMCLVYEINQRSSVDELLEQISLK